jgi:signal transduction histidine kinase
MSETINDFMYFFNPKNENETFSLKEVIDTSLNLFNSRELKCKIEVNTQADMENKILGTKNGLVQVLLNLLSNASDSIENCDTNTQIEYLIKINVKNDSKNIIIEVEDNGKGIDEKIINRIFEPYFTTKFKSHGTGIGLYMSKVIIEEHMKGSLTVKNGSKGAIFTILLPMVS